MLCQASKALDLLEREKSSEFQRSQMMIDALNQKIESLNHEVSSLQNALVETNKSNLGNDTGYADFLGAVDSKDIERQKLHAELKETEANFNTQMAVMTESLRKLELEKKEIESNAATLESHNNKLKDKCRSFFNENKAGVSLTFAFLAELIVRNFNCR